MAGHMKNFNPKGRKRTPNIFVDPQKGLAERRKHMLEHFKNFNAEAANLDELVEVAAFGRQFRAEHESLNVPVPEYVDDNLRAIRREIDGRLADKRAARVRELKSQRDSLKTAAERREAIDKELAALGEPVAV
jgi:hypothetical protein